MSYLRKARLGPVPYLNILGGGVKKTTLYLRKASAGAGATWWQGWWQTRHLAADGPAGESQVQVQVQEDMQVHVQVQVSIS